MRKRPRCCSRKDNKSNLFSAAIDLNPLLDVVFILLIFFILTANVAQNVFDLNLPKPDESYKSEKDLEVENTIRLTLFTNGEYAIEGKKVLGYNSLKEYILEEYNKNPFINFLVIVENTLPVERMLELLTFFRSKEITKIDILLTK